MNRSNGHFFKNGVEKELPVGQFCRQKIFKKKVKNPCYILKVAGTI
jgi:hypothetical protein